MNNLPADKNRRILIIDDNRAIHDDFRKILSPPTIAAAALDATEAELFGKPVPHGAGWFSQSAMKLTRPIRDRTECCW